MSKYKIKFICMLFMAFGTACEPNYLPKPRGYIRITLPPHQYKHYQSGCPFEFQYSAQAKVVPKPGVPEEKCWLNIIYPELKATVHLSYKEVNDNLPVLIEESRNLAYKHTIKANDIEEVLIKHPENKVYGIKYILKGDVASYLQFYATDSTSRFIRGALYFNYQSDYDSLSPVIDYISQDTDTFLSTLRWK
ncbi:MAG: gliding motility lipoprotein GldD [Bacteroidetes bacterium]|nr:MAG: gliding motility lipoprotein GldD [Bacteroidota bacterium]